MPDTITYVSSKNFKKLVSNGGDTKNVLVVKHSVADITKADDDPDSRKLRFIISTDSVDRDSDTINQKGWNLKAFKKNSVVLFAHDSSQLPVARASDTKIEDGMLKSTAEFTSADLNPFGDTVFRMIQEKFLKATSVGFLPIDFDFVDPDDDDVRAREWGIDFHKQELLEFSIVPVPSNPEALIEARGKGIDTAPLCDWYEEALDTWANHKDLLLVPKSVIEKLYKASSEDKPKVFHLSKTEQNDLLMRNLRRIKVDAQRKEQSQSDKYKSAISWFKAHPDGCEVSDQEQYSMTPLPSKLSVKQQKQFSTLCVEDSYYLYHHVFDDGKLSIPAVKQCMDALLDSSFSLVNTIPDGERKGVYDHLARHYKEFDEEPPEFKEVAELDGDAQVSDSEEDIFSEPNLPSVQDIPGEEISTDPVETPEAETEEVDDALPADKESQEAADSAEAEAGDEADEDTSSTETIEPVAEIVATANGAEPAESELVGTLNTLTATLSQLVAELQGQETAPVEATVEEEVTEDDDFVIAFIDDEGDDKTDTSSQEEVVAGIIAEILPDILSDIVQTKLSQMRGKVD